MATDPSEPQRPKMVKVLRVEREAEEHCTLWLEHSMAYQPGQFVMIWIPRVDEKPFTIGYVRDDSIGLTIQKRGRVTSQLMEMKAGESVGIRGPYGRGFDPHRRGLIVAGGCGLATVAPIKDLRPETPILYGAAAAEKALYVKRFPDMTLCTDDGSAGHHGFPADLLPDVLRRGDVETVYTCGPEVMMKRVFEICEEHNVECQAALERYMKCGFGVCGQCACGHKLVCLDGPVFDSAVLRTLDEFGQTARLKTGEKVPLNEYVEWRYSST